MALTVANLVVQPGGSSSQPADELLVRRLRDGEVAAGEVLVQRYHEPLMRYLRRLARSDHLAEELHQQTWLSVLEHIKKFDAGASGGGFKAWLFRIATNKANDAWRSRGREMAAYAGVSRIAEQQTPDASQPVVTAELTDRLRLALDRLPEPQRQVLLLRYYSGLKFVEIAELLGCPLNTALGRMHKAMLKLKQLMDEPGEALGGVTQTTKPGLQNPPQPGTQRPAK
jgi:RNA polymerase sigma-70 factor (ECF subfamily)